MTNTRPLHSFLVDGEKYTHLTRAAQIVGLSGAALSRWARDGITSYGLELTVRRQGKRRLIPERQVRILAELNRIYPLPRHGFLPRDQLDDLRRAARAFGRSQSIDTPQP